MWDYYKPKPRLDASLALEKLKKDNPAIKPVVVQGTKLAKSWWAKEWNNNLERYADFSNRVARGRSYVRGGAVLHLQIEQGVVEALVQGSRKKPYNVTVRINRVGEDKLEKISKQCSDSISNIETLLAGKFPTQLAELFTKKGFGLFPAPKEISFYCSCPDSAYMCKHVAAVLYGIGVRLDSEPLLFFTLMGIDVDALVAKSVDKKIQTMLKNVGKPTKRTIIDPDTKALFGI